MNITISQLKQLIKEVAEELNEKGFGEGTPKKGETYKKQTIELEEMSANGANIAGGASHGSLPSSDEEAVEEEEEEVEQRHLKQKGSGLGAGAVPGNYAR